MVVSDDAGDGAVAGTGTLSSESVKDKEKRYCMLNGLNFIHESAIHIHLTDDGKT